MYTDFKPGYHCFGPLCIYMMLFHYYHITSRIYIGAWSIRVKFAVNLEKVSDKFINNFFHAEMCIVARWPCAAARCYEVVRLVIRLLRRVGSLSTSRCRNWRLFVSASRSNFAITHLTDSSPFQHWTSTSLWQRRRRVQSPSILRSKIPPWLTHSTFCATHRNASKTSCSKCLKSTWRFDVFYDCASLSVWGRPYCFRSFAFCRPTMWNSLPSALCDNSLSKLTFRTHQNHSALIWVFLWFWRRLLVFILTYLLTNLRTQK